MSEQQRRRSKIPEAPETPTGYRSSRRASKAAKAAKKAERSHKASVALTRTGRGVKNFLWVLLTIGAWVLGTVIVLLLVATAVNTFVRWNAQRIAERDAQAPIAEKARDNLLVIGVDQAGAAKGFLAVKFDRRGNQVFGVAIPDGAFIEVPGKGFDRIGESLKEGPDISTAAVSNFLAVPFTTYLIVPEAAYKGALTAQSVASLGSAVTSSSLSADDLAKLSADLARVPQKNVALVPMPVKPLKLGNQTYFEPQAAEVADLIKSWWGVDVTNTSQIVRVIVYNGAGVPGIAGQAGQQLIRAGYRVVDTKNADNFNYAKTQVIVRRGDASRGQGVAKALGVGEVKLDPSEADVTDVIVIIGKDYKAPSAKKE